MLARVYTCAQPLSVKCEAESTVQTIQLPDGERYVGEINGEGQPHGSGTKFRADGSEVASGQWRDGKLHGRGKTVLSSGGRHEGDFVDGEFSDLGTFTWADGRIFEGEWADNKRSGFGVKWNKDGKMLKCGRWANGKLVKSCPVPLVKISVGKFLSAAGEPRLTVRAARALDSSCAEELAAA